MSRRSDSGGLSHGGPIAKRAFSTPATVFRAGRGQRGRCRVRSCRFWHMSASASACGWQALSLGKRGFLGSFSSMVSPLSSQANHDSIRHVGTNTKTSSSECLTGTPCSAHAVSSWAMRPVTPAASPSSMTTSAMDTRFLWRRYSFSSLGNRSRTNCSAEPRPRDAFSTLSRCFDLRVSRPVAARNRSTKACCCLSSHNRTICTSLLTYPILWRSARNA